MYHSMKASDWSKSYFSSTAHAVDDLSDPNKPNSNKDGWVIHSGFHEILLITSGVLVVLSFL